MDFNKIRLVGLTNIDLPLVGLATPADAYICRSVTGLGPPDGDASIARIKDQSGIPLGRRLQPRQIVSYIGLNPNYALGQTVKGLREELYGLLYGDGGEVIKVQIMMDNVVLAETSGIVTKFEASLFSEDPAVQLTIDCLGSYLTAPLFVSVASPVKTVSGAYTLFDLFNEGNAPVGYFLSIKFNGPHTGTFQIHSDANNPFRPILSITHPFEENDTLTINTVPGRRGISKIPAGEVDGVSILGDRTSSDWLMLRKGLNHLKVNNPDIDWGVFGFTYTPQWWGV